MDQPTVSEKQSSRRKRPLSDENVEDLLNQTRTGEILVSDLMEEDSDLEEEITYAEYKAYYPSLDDSDEESADGIKAEEVDEECYRIEPPPKRRIKEEEIFCWRDLGNDEGTERSVGDFTEGPSVKLQKEDPTMFDVFDELFPLEIYKLMVEETNRYAQNFIEERKANKSLRRHSRYRRWTPVTVEEMKQFLAILLLMGMHHFPTMHMYWTTNNLFTSGACSQIMTRDRFLNILRCWHFSFELDGKDKQKVLKSFLDLLQKSLEDKYYPARNLSLDEPILPFEGKLGSKKFIPTKTSNIGIRIFKLVDQNNVTLRSFIYTGTKKEIKHFSKSESVVVEMMEPYLNKGHIIYTHNFFTSSKLYKFLYKNRTGAVGTIRSKRKELPKEMLSLNVKTGEKYAYETDELLYVQFAVESKVFMLSNITQNTEVTVKRRSRKGLLNQKVPTAVHVYNTHMGYVDGTDQILEYYAITRKSIKWYRKLAFHLIQVRVLDAMGIYNLITDKKATFLEFSEAVVRGLLDTLNIPQDQPGKRIVSGAHYIRRIGRRENNSQITRRCRICAKKGAGKATTVFECEKCIDPKTKLHIALCLEPCFKDYHTKFSYGK